MNKRTAAALVAGLMMVSGSSHAESLFGIRGKRQHVRLAGELGALFAAGHEWYWRDNGSSNVVDWQLPHGAAAVEAKLDPGGWRFDGNPYAINALGHPGFGTLTYFLGRQNGYTGAESFLISSLASGSWETFLELREYGSLNDLAMTSPAGVPIGETAFQILHHLRETRFELGTGFGVENGEAFGVASVRGELDRIPTTGDGRLATGQQVDFAVETQTDTAGLRSAEGGAKSVLGGFYRNRNGNRLVVAATAAFDYRNRAARPEREWDLLTKVGFGPSIEYRARVAGAVVELGTDAHLDFGMLKSEAFDAWRAEHPSDEMRNVLENREHPYYYAGGLSLDPHVTVTHGRFVAGAKVAAGVFSSIDGHDRDSELIDTKLHMSDTDASGQASLSYGRDNINVTLEGRVHERSGSANDAHGSTNELGTTLTVGYRL